MIRGVSTEFIFDLSCSFSNLSAVQIVFWQEGYSGLSDSRPLPIFKVLEQCTQGPKPKQLSVMLNREETMRFKEDRKAYVQLTGITSDGQGIGQKKEVITVYPIYDNSALDGELSQTVDYNGWVYLDGGYIDDGESDDFSESVTYTISNNLVNVTTSNASLTATKDASYTATLTATTGYDINLVTVRMNDVDISSSVYSNGTINIPAVTGNIVIIATATPVEVKTYNITNHLTNVVTSNSSTTVNDGSTYGAVLTANDEHMISSVTVIVNGEDVTSSVYSNGTIAIASVHGDIVIIATATEIVTHNVTYSFTHVTPNTTVSTVTDGAAYYVRLDADEGYEMDTVTVIVGGVNVTSEVYTGDTTSGTITIESVTGDVDIVATATALNYYTITNNLTNVSTSNETTQVIANYDYRSTLTPAEGYTIISVTVVMGDEDVTDLAYKEDTSEVIISIVYDNVVVTAVAVVVGDEPSTDSHDITYNLINVSASNEITTIENELSYNTILTANDGYVMKNITVTMGDEDVTSLACIEDRNEVIISLVSDDVVIAATAI